MRVGVMVPLSTSDGVGRMPSWTDIRVFAEHAEAAGIDSLWVANHFFGSMPGAPLEGVHEAWTISSALAAAPSRVEVGQLVTCAAYRSPALLAKMAVTADAVSGGRLVLGLGLGLGAGWHDPEYQAFGYPTDHRVGRSRRRCASSFHCSAGRPSALPADTIASPTPSFFLRPTGRSRFS